MLCVVLLMIVRLLCNLFLWSDVVSFWWFNDDLV